MEPQVKEQSTARGVHRPFKMVATKIPNGYLRTLTILELVVAKIISMWAGPGLWIRLFSG